MPRSAARSRPPGSRHKSGGWRVLSMPLEDAREAAEHPCGPGVWAGLLAEFAAELRQAGQPVTGEALFHRESLAELDDTGAPWVPRLGGRAPLGAELEHVARTGRWDRSRYAGRSLRPAWPSWARRRPVAGSSPTSALRWPAARGRAWPRCTRGALSRAGWSGFSRPEWRKYHRQDLGEENVRQWHTSDLSTRPPAQESSHPQRSTVSSASGLPRFSARPRIRSGSKAGVIVLSRSAWCCSRSARPRWSAGPA